MAAPSLLHALVLQRRGFEFARKEHAAADLWWMSTEDWGIVKST